MYTTTNYRTKKQLKEAVAAGEKVTYFDPGPHMAWRSDGRFAVEGPHYPEPHKWYAECVAKDGVIVSVK